GDPRAAHERWISDECVESRFRAIENLWKLDPPVKRVEGMRPAAQVAQGFFQSIMSRDRVFGSLGRQVRHKGFEPVLPFPLVFLLEEGRDHQIPITPRLVEEPIRRLELLA